MFSVCDRLTKWFFLEHSVLYRGPLLQLNLSKNNKLFYFSINQTVLVIFSLFVLVVLCIGIFKALHDKNILLTTALLLVGLGGASNIADRVVHEFVIDWAWIIIIPNSVFNIADVMIVSGIILISLYYFFPQRLSCLQPKKEGREKKHSQ